MNSLRLSMREISFHRGNEYMVEKKGKNRLMWGMIVSGWGVIHMVGLNCFGWLVGYEI